MGLLDILKQYADPSSAPNADVSNHFDQAARDVPPSQLGGGIAAAFRSDATPPFGQTVGSLFGQSNPQQQAGVVNQLVQSLSRSGGAGALSGIAGGILGRLFDGNAPAGAVPTVTPTQASQLSPDDVSALASHAEQHSPTIVDEVGSFYAQHPTLVKTLGAVALSAVMGHLGKR